MGIAERREREKEQRRNDIIDAAEQVFFKKGWQNATMDEVAAVAELSKGTLYLYFKSKEELYLAILLRGFDIMTNLFVTGMSAVTRGLDQVRAIGEAYLKFYQDYPDYFNILHYFQRHQLDPEDSGSEIVQACYQSAERGTCLVQNAIELGISDGSIRADIDPHRTALVLWGAASGVFQVASIKSEILRGKHSTEPETMITEFFEFVERALQP